MAKAQFGLNNKDKRDKTVEGVENHVNNIINIPAAPRLHKININLTTDDFIKFKTWCLVNQKHQQEQALTVLKNWLDNETVNL